MAEWRPQGPAVPQGVARQPSDRRVEPPLVVQNAMLTKDKKPFTYTPGGIDLSEISSPRLARRVERNAMAPGVSEVQRSSPPRYTGTLPPSALAAMQPAMPVQVFPSGPPPPPPIPAGGHAPPPPPPPMQPLPTTSFATNEGVFERPDMTKIIPENPMALLKKAPRVQRPSSDGIEYGRPVDGHYQTPVNVPQMVQQRPVEAPPPPQPEIKTSTAQLGTLYIPPVDNQNRKMAATPPVIERAVQSPPITPQKAPQTPTSPQSPVATLTKSPRPWQNQKPPQQEAPAWAQRQQQQPDTPQGACPSAQSPPVYQQRGPPTPGTPTATPCYQTPPPQIRGGQSPSVQGNVIGRVIIPIQPGGEQQGMNVDAVYVTQPVVLQHPGTGGDQGQQQLREEQQMRQQEQQMRQQEQQKRQQEQQKRQQEEQMRQQEQQRIAQQQRAEQQLRQQQQMQQQQMQQQQMQQQQMQQQQLQQQQMQQQQLQQQQMQQQQQQQQQKIAQQQNAQGRGEQKNVRIIPIQIEGNANSNGNVQRRDSNKFGSGSPVTPGSARVFNRQPSWTQGGPTQSNSFKVIQKLTNTDGDDDEDEDPSEHPPRNSQQFQQVPSEQTRKMTLNDGDRELMNKVKQVPRSPQNVGNSVRMIPVQIEGEPSGNYIPPSEQTVQEPKKYTGGKIPSRSFKMLQAMTGDPCGPDQSDL